MAGAGAAGFARFAGAFFFAVRGAAGFALFTVLFVDFAAARFGAAFFFAAIATSRI